MKTKVFHLVLVFVLAASMAGCSLGGDQTLTPLPPVSSNELDIVSAFAFTDQWGWYNVAGEIQNNTGAALTSIELTIEIRDASGNSLLKDDNGGAVESLKFSPLLYTLAPGQYAPFSYSFDTSVGIPASYNVTVTGHTTGQADRADIIVENAEMVDDGGGMFYLSGVLVNQGSGWAHINSLAGAGLDSNSQVLTADWTATYTTELAPAGDASGRDRTPFSVGFPVPVGAEVTGWAVYTDADVVDAPTDYALAVNITNRYFDGWNSYHVVGTVTNNSPERLHTLLVGGLYAGDGTTLDATWSFIPVFIEPGATIPFDMSSFGSVNWSTKQASRVDRATVQVDPWSTYPSSWEVVALAASNEQVVKNGADWTFIGSVTNNSGQALSGETVIVAVHDAQGNLVASSYSYVTPDGDAIANGQTSAYEVSVYLDPAADTAGYTTQTIVQGDVK
ncbi:MAG: hypothetical protein FD146_1233 [Anaerolineaceae bacterium]|nr:MAG: hypothetical protein FD146_1233 [Anaerolineaceae bacterium]